MYSKIIAVGRLQESAIMYAGDVKDVIVFKLYPDTPQSSEGDSDDISAILPLECRYEVYKGDDYLLALKPGTMVFIEGDIFLSENPDAVLKCTVENIFMIVEQEMNQQS